MEHTSFTPFTFMSFVKQSNIDDKFIAVKNGRYHLVNEKTPECLTAEQINKIAKKLVDSTDSFWGKSDEKLKSDEILLEELSTLCKHYHGRENKILPDINFSKLAGIDIGSHKITSQKSHIDLTPFEQEISKKLSNSNISNQEVQMRRFYAKVLENSDYANEKYEGYLSNLAMRSYINDLKDYTKQYEGKCPQKLTDLIAELEIAYEMDLLSACIESRKIDPEQKFGILENVVQKIHDLPISTKEHPSSLVLPGGYLGKDESHLVLYKIERTSKNGFNLSIIDTGSISNIDNLFRVAVFNSRRKVKDVHFSGLTEENLSSEFLLMLINIKNFKNMEEVNKMIEAQCPNAKESKGRERSGQNKGTCTFKAVSSYIHERLGNEMHNDFKFFVADRELTNLEAMRNEINSGKIKTSDSEKKELDQMLVEGTKIFEKRKNKVDKHI
jgi:hypothetical protein